MTGVILNRRVVADYHDRLHPVGHVVDQGFVTTDVGAVEPPVQADVHILGEMRHQQGKGLAGALGGRTKNHFRDQAARGEEPSDKVGGAAATLVQWPGEVLQAGITPA